MLIPTCGENETLRGLKYREKVTKILDADLKVLVLQITTSGEVTGVLNYQVFPLGIGADEIQISSTFAAGIAVPNFHRMRSSQIPQTEPKVSP